MKTYELILRSHDPALLGGIGEKRLALITGDNRIHTTLEARIRSVLRQLKDEGKLVGRI